jgi:hypothetical protein
MKQPLTYEREELPDCVTACVMVAGGRFPAKRTKNKFGRYRGRDSLSWTSPPGSVYLDQSADSSRLIGDSM